MKVYAGYVCVRDGFLRVLIFETPCFVIVVIVDLFWEECLTRFRRKIEWNAMTSKLVPKARSGKRQRLVAE